jgi:minor extracellular serine protease Vpr
MLRSQTLVLLSIASSLAIAAPIEHYTLVLADPPAASEYSSRAALKTPAAQARIARIQDAQRKLVSTLADHEISVTGSISTLANAVFVAARPDQVAELKALPGVQAVVKSFKLKPALNRALDLVNAKPAWDLVGGASKAGAGVKIAILDTGIDETHPALVDPSLSFPSGFPKFNTDDDKKHTTTKVIVARSYADILGIFTGIPEVSLDDDFSARDRMGHGTAVAMAAAGNSIASPVGNISGVAPKAWLGNYKIFGSPGVNDYTRSDVVMQAIEAAYTDGMDIALVAAGSLPGLWLPTDVAPTCPFLSAGSFCDPWAAALANAIAGGLTIVVPAGDDGELGLATINTPGTLPAIITVGASSNVQQIHQTAVTSTPDYVSMLMSNGPQLQAPLTAPLVDDASIESTGTTCSALPASSLAGKIALILRGNCSFGTKAINAAAAGAVGILFYDVPGGTVLFSPGGLANSSVPSALVTSDAGAFLKNYLSAHPGGVVTLDPTTAVVAITDPEAYAVYSSTGPNITDSGIKPELVAPGTLYTAAQNYDPNGKLYSANRYTAAEGTSLSAALVAGAVAVVKQAHPNYTAGQLKSAVTNTAVAGVITYDSTGAQIPAFAVEVGAGKLNVAQAVQTNVTVEPSTVNFGAVSGPLSKSLKFTNTGTTSVSLSMSVTQRFTDAKATVTVTPSTLTLSPGQGTFVTVALTGSAPAIGYYEGIIAVNGGAVPLRIPYLYAVRDVFVDNLIPLEGQEFVVESGNAVKVSIKAIDSSGLPLSGVPIAFAAPNGGAVDPNDAGGLTDSLGISEGRVFMANTVGDTGLLAGIPNVGTIEIDGRTRAIPNITSGGIVDAASLQVPSGGFAPGSYITIFGTGLSENTMVYNTSYLPVSLNGVSVSFDSPSTSVHAAGHLHFVSPGQINVQVPWELAGSTSAIIKVTLSNSSSYFARADNSNLGTNQSQTVTIPIGQYSPGFFGPTDTAAAIGPGGVVNASNPVARGAVVSLYVNGLGAVTPSVPSGDPASSTVLTPTQATPIVNIGGQPATVQFSGLAPGFVSLYQVNVFVPQGVSTGQVPVTLSIGSISAKGSFLYVK